MDATARMGLEGGEKMAAKRRNAAPRHISPEQDRHMRLRTRIFCISMAVVCFGVLLWRLFMLQIIDPEGYAARAADQQLRDTVIPAARCGTGAERPVCADSRPVHGPWRRVHQPGKPDPRRSRTLTWLRGEEDDAAVVPNGWCAVCVDGYPLGCGKVSGGRIKKRYPKALRMLG